MKRIKPMSRALIYRLKKHNVKVIDKSVTLESVYETYAGRCQECRKPTVMGLHPQANHSATMEHRIPISMGGNHMWENVTLLCYQCNNRNNHKIMNSPVRKFRFFGFEIAIKKVAA